MWVVSQGFEYEATLYYVETKQDAKEVAKALRAQDPQEYIIYYKVTPEKSQDIIARLKGESNV